MSNLNDLPEAAKPAAKPARKISANVYVTCPCGVRAYKGEDIYPLWCYTEGCPCTDKRWPDEWQVKRFGLDQKILGRPGWEPGARAPAKKVAA